jgi:hypothetical protein
VWCAVTARENGAGKTGTASVNRSVMVTGFDTLANLNCLFARLATN